MLLMIDEEIRRISSVKDYFEELGFQVTLLRDVASAFQFIGKHKHNIEAIILDVMMPWGTLFTSEETMAGLITGYKLLERIRDAYGYDIPVIMYTAVHKPDLFNRLKRQQNCSVLHKPDPPFKIVKELQKYGVHPKDR